MVSRAEPEDDGLPGLEVSDRHPGVEASGPVHDRRDHGPLPEQEVRGRLTAQRSRAERKAGIVDRLVGRAQPFHGRQEGEAR